MDSILALALVVVGVNGTRYASVIQPSTAPLRPLAFALVTVAALALIMRRPRPLFALAVATLATSVYLYQGYPYGPILISLLIAVYTVARWCSARTAAIAAALVMGFLLIHVVIGRGIGPGLLGVVPISAWVVVPFAAGVTIRVHTESVAQSRAEWARRHADEERLRVAREVHDVVGHGLSAIAMQAEIALHVLPKQPQHAAVALAAISRTSREALEELRVTLAGVRSDPDGEDRSPLPGLASLDQLVLRMSDSGVTVAVESTGERRGLPDGVDLAAYRVIQESLTNVLRHAGPASVTVRLGFGPGELAIEVADNGQAATPIGELGHGIPGMRQRVEALGGSFSAGPADGGGFRVSARIPS